MGLMDVLNGMANGPRGQAQPGQGMSKVTMAMLALLAYKAYQKMNANQPQATPANNPNVSPNANPGGGLGGLLGGLFGGNASAGGGLGGLLNGGLGGLLAGGAAGGVLSGGLGELIKQFQQNGHGDTANSWVGTGENKQISPNDLGKALGDDTVNSLAEQAGLSRVELLDGMSQQLPHLVDQMTPQGTLPDEHEVQKML